MKRSAFLIAALLLATLFEHSAVWAQQRPNGPGGGGPGSGQSGGQGGGQGGGPSSGQHGGSGQDHNSEERRAQRREMHRENIERRQEAAAQRNEPRNEPNTNRAPEGGNQQRMSPDERRQLREQIRNHGRENYTPAKR